MRILAIGDIHGCTVALDLLLLAVKPEPDDLIITLGDYVDRGPDSKGTVQRLIDLGATQRLVPLRGNHDEMMLGARGRPEAMTWLLCGGLSTLVSYSGRKDVGGLAAVPAQHWAFLEKCSLWHETATHFFVHANAAPGLLLAEQSEDALLWQRLDDPEAHISGKVMVCGHTAQKNGTPLNLGHTICIDTWAYGEGWLTCLDVVSGQVWQASQQGQVRTAHIDDFLTVV